MKHGFKLRSHMYRYNIAAVGMLLFSLGSKLNNAKLNPHVIATSWHMYIIMFGKHINSARQNNIIARKLNPEA